MTLMNIGSRSVITETLSFVEESETSCHGREMEEEWEIIETSYVSLSLLYDLCSKIISNLSICNYTNISTLNVIYVLDFFFCFCHA